MFGNAQPGNVTITATKGRGHSPEELADMALEKIIYVSKDMPPEIKEQALVYRDRIRSVLIHYLEKAQRSEMTTLNSALLKHGKEELVTAIRNGDL
jgi:hypothetical protein